jgi:HSF-type DNA-binding
MIKSNLFFLSASESYLAQPKLGAQKRDTIINSAVRPSLVGTLESSDVIGSPLRVMEETLLSSHPVADFGGVKKEDFLCYVSGLNDDAFFYQYAHKFNPQKVNKNEPFPLKLYRIIHEAHKNGQEEIISFCPSGQSFMVHNIDEFAKNIMPKYFTSNRMTSFQRQLHLYGFRRILRGDDKGGFWHESFIFGQRNRCLTIKRKVQTFRVPPHLLTDESSPSPAVVTPTHPRPLETKVSHLMIQATSPAWRETDRLSLVTSSRRRPSILEWPPSAGSSIASNNGILSLTPRLGPEGLGNDFAYFRGNLVDQTPSSNTIELLRLSQKIQMAKEIATLRHNMALAAIHRLGNIVDLEERPRWSLA